MRPAFRLLPLPLCIVLSLAAQADDDIPVNWALCPVEDAVPLFPDAQPPTGSAGDREGLPTDIRGDQTVGVDGGPHTGFLDVIVTSNATFDEAAQKYTADTKTIARLCVLLAE